MSDVIDGWREIIQQSIEREVSKINTSMPGTIVSYNPATNMAVVRPSIPKHMANDLEVGAPQIVRVPVLFPNTGMVGGKQASMTFPVGPGTPVKLDFCERSMEGWLSGKNTMPDDPRQFDLSDCIATPGLSSSGLAGDTNNVVLRFDKCQVVLGKDNSITMGNENGSIHIGEDGTLTLKAMSIRVEAGGRAFTLELHNHPGIEPGPGTTGPPQ